MTTRTISGAEYERRVRQLEADGLTRSDAQGVADADLLKAGESVDWTRREPPALVAGTQAALIALALDVLAQLEIDTDWSSSTTDEIAAAAARHGLVDWRTTDGLFAVLPELRAAAGLPEVPRPVFADEDACPDDPDGLHHVGCGCEDGA